MKTLLLTLLLLGTLFAEEKAYVIDKEQHLMWQQCDKSASFDRAFVYKSAQSYCDNLYLLRYDDWRLPTAKELQTVFHNKILKNLAEDGYWSSDRDPKDPEDNALAVYSENGHIYAQDTCEDTHIICVR